MGQISIKNFTAIGTKGGIVVGFEQDLYFEDRYITQRGKILTKEEMERLK